MLAVGVGCMLVDYWNILSVCIDLEVFFAEVDFRETEGEGAIRASIIKEGPLVSDLYLDIFPLTYDEFDSRGFTLDADRRQERPDPAECECMCYSFQLDGICSRNATC